MSNVNWKAFWLSSVLVFIFIFAFDFVYHGQFMMPFYQQTPELWRPVEEMPAYGPWMMGTQAVMALLLTFLFTRNYEGKGLMEGVRFGIYVGLPLGVSHFAAYAWMPISLTVAWLWLFAWLCTGVGAGIILALLYKKPAA